MREPHPTPEQPTPALGNLGGTETHPQTNNNIGVLRCRFCSARVLSDSSATLTVLPLPKPFHTPRPVNTTPPTFTFDTTNHTTFWVTPSSDSFDNIGLSAPVSTPFTPHATVKIALCSQCTRGPIGYIPDISANVSEHGGEVWIVADWVVQQVVVTEEQATLDFKPENENQVRQLIINQMAQQLQQQQLQQQLPPLPPPREVKIKTTTVTVKERRIGMRLNDSIDGKGVEVVEFVSVDDDDDTYTPGPVESSGLVAPMDLVISVGESDATALNYESVLELIINGERPLKIRFERWAVSSGEVAYDFTKMSDVEWRIFDFALPNTTEIEKHKFGFAEDEKTGRGLAATATLEKGKVGVQLIWEKVLTLQKAEKGLEALEINGKTALLQRGLDGLKGSLQNCSPLIKFTLTLAIHLLGEIRLNLNSKSRPWWNLLPVPSTLEPLCNCVEKTSDTVTDLLILALEKNGNVANLLGDRQLETEVNSEFSFLRAKYDEIFSPLPLFDLRDKKVSTNHKCPFKGCTQTSPDGLETEINVCPDHREVLVSFKSFLWAFTLIRSRAMELNVDGTIVRAVLPLIDMCNHSTNGSNVKLECGTSGVSLVAKRTIREGEQIYLDYGQRSLREVCRSFGFVLEEGEVEGGEVEVDDAEALLEGGNETASTKLASQYRRARNHAISLSKI